MRVNLAHTGFAGGGAVDEQGCTRNYAILKCSKNALVPFRRDTQVVCHNDEFHLQITVTVVVIAGTVVLHGFARWLRRPAKKKTEFLKKNDILVF